MGRSPGGGSGFPRQLRPLGGEIPPRAPAALSAGEKGGSVRVDDLLGDRLMASLGKKFSSMVLLARDQSMSIWTTLAWVLLAWESMAAPACTSML